MTMSSEEKNGLIGVTAIALRVAVQFSGRTIMDPDGQCIDAAEALVKKLEARGYLPDLR